MLALAVGPVALPTDVLVFGAVGLLAGAHCLGMCGPLVALYGSRMRDGTGGRQGHRGDVLTPHVVGQHALFNLGRATSYALLGMLFAVAGGVLFAGVDLVEGAATPLRVVTGLLVGTAIVMTGLFYLLGRLEGVHRLGVPWLSRPFAWANARLGPHVDRLADGPGVVLLGGVHGLLPCPVIYPAYLYAFVLGDPLRAGLLLFVLGLGTLPTLFVAGTFLSTLSVPHRVTLHRLMGVTLLVLGYIPLSHALVLLGVDVPHLHVPFYQPLGGAG